MQHADPRSLASPGAALLARLRARFVRRRAGGRYRRGELPARSSRRRWPGWSTSPIGAASARMRATGDGAGLLIQVPHALFAADLAEAGAAGLAAGDYGVAMIFLPQ